MRQRHWLASFVLAAILTTTQLGAEEPGSEPASLKQQTENILRKANRNGDGKVDEQERLAAHKFLEQHLKQELLKRVDANGDGKIDAQERAAAKKLRHKHHEQAQVQDGKTEPRETRKPHGASPRNGQHQAGQPGQKSSGPRGKNG